MRAIDTTNGQLTVNLITKVEGNDGQVYTKSPVWCTLLTPPMVSLSARVGGKGHASILQTPVLQASGVACGDELEPSREPVVEKAKQVTHCSVHLLKCILSILPTQTRTRNCGTEGLQLLVQKEAFVETKKRHFVQGGLHGDQNALLIKIEDLQEILYTHLHQCIGRFTGRQHRQCRKRVLRLGTEQQAGEDQRATVDVVSILPGKTSSHETPSRVPQC